MCFKKIWDYIKKVFGEAFKPKNVAIYVVLFLISLGVASIFQYWITPHPKIEIDMESIEVETSRIRIKNIGDKATENLQFRLLYNSGCILGVDEVELKFFNDTKKDYTGSYNDPPYSKKWIVEGFELNPGVEISFFCERNSPFQIRISGSNFKELVESYTP